MTLGWLDVCLTVSDVCRSREFYEELGFARVEGEDSEGWAVMVNGESRIGLYHKEHMGESTHTLNFRGGNVTEIVRSLQEKNMEFDSGFQAKDDGTGSAFLKDPDGHPIFFDTAPGEIKKIPGSTI